MRRYALYFLLFLGLMAATRLPVIPGQLFSFDEVNMVYAMDKLDTRLSQPQPPGYPLFILEMRVLRGLRFVRPESILIALSVLGSAASMAALVWCGDRIFGGWTGLYGALLLGLHPSFWYTGLTSALRIQLALISALVAGCCWRAWKGEEKWNLYGALALGLGAGIRPEAGPLLVPLWAVGVLRPGVTWKNRALAPLVLTGAVLCWLVPLALNSGGFVPFFRHSLAYLAVQSGTSSSLFGLAATRWLTVAIQLVVWSFSGLVFLPMLLALARGAGDRVGRLRWTFLWVWIGPSLLFAWFIHVADPGHTLAIVAPVCLFLGHEVTRAVAMRAQWRSPDWQWVVPAIILASVPSDGPDSYRLMTLALSLVVAIVVRFRPIVDARPLGHAHAAGLVFLPIAILAIHTVFGGGWEYHTSPDMSAERVWLDVKQSLHLSSYKHVGEVVNPDDKEIRAAQQAVAGAPGTAVVVSERSLTSWRKVSYYLPTTRLVVLEKISGTPPQASVTEWLRSVRKGQYRGALPQTVEVPAGARLVWLIHPRSTFGAAVRQGLPVTEAGPVAFTDLPKAEGSRQVGDYLFVWK